MILSKKLCILYHIFSYHVNRIFIYSLITLFTAVSKSKNKLNVCLPCIKFGWYGWWWYFSSFLPGKETWFYLQTRRIEFHVACGLKIPRIAELLGRNPTSIREEILKHRLDSNKRYGCSNRLCARFDECTRTIFNGFKDRIRKNTPNASSHARTSARRPVRGFPVLHSSATVASKSASVR